MADNQIKKVQFFLGVEDSKRLRDFEARNPAAKKMQTRAKIFLAGMNQIIKDKR